MTKNKDYVVHVQSSTFKELLAAQKESLGTLKSMKQIMEGLTVIQPDKAKPEAKKIEEETFRARKTLNNLHQDEIRNLKEKLKLQDEEAQAITNIAKSMQVFYSPLEKTRMGLEKMKSSFTEGGGIRGALLKSFNIGGIFNKSIEREKFIRAQKTMGSDKTRAELKEDFKSAQASRKEIDKNEEKIKSFQKMTGLSESDMAKTKGGRELLDKRKSIAEEFAKYDERAKLVRRGEPIIKPSMGGIGAEQFNKSPTQKFADKGQQEEADLENARLMGEQTVLLTKIEENTRGAAPDQKAAGGEGGSGVMAGIGAGLKALGIGLKGLGAGAGAGIKALLIGIGQGLKAVGAGLKDLLESGGKGIGSFIRGLALGLAALAAPPVLIGLTAATLAIMGIGKALEMAAPFMEAFAPVLIKVADVIQNTFVAAVEKLPEILGQIGDIVLEVISAISEAVLQTIDAVTSSIERLAELDGSNLLKIGAGLISVAGGLMAFSAAQVGAGLTNIVSGLLSSVSGQKTPIDQLKDLAQFGPNLEKAGTGVEKLGSGLKSFSSIDTEKIKAIAALPTEKIAAMGAVMGNAGTVYSKSGENAGAVVKGGGNTQTNVVNAPVNNVTKQTQIIRSPIRNRDSSIHEYLRTRYSPA